MSLLTSIFYLLATSLLIPVMLALLFCLVRVLTAMGGMLRQHRNRTRMKPSLDQFTRDLDRGIEPHLRLSDARIVESNLLAGALAGLIKISSNEVLAEKVIHDCQVSWTSQLDRFRSLARLGPALGLMGTLIPLGPALVGLAAGNLEMMSSNLVIAFATTVVGLLIGTLASLLAGVQKRWNHADAVLVTYAANRLPQINHSKSRLGEDSPANELEQEGVLSHA